MTRADEVLDLIDTTLGDWTVGPDAMRSVPTPDDAPDALVLTPERVADAFDVPRRLASPAPDGPADAAAALRELRDTPPSVSGTAYLVLSPPDLARIQRLFEHYRTRVNQAWETVRPTFERTRAMVAAARPTRGDHWTLWPPPRQEPDPKAWIAFTDQPGRQKRVRRGPDPRRVSIRRAPARTGRRP